MTKYTTKQYSALINVEYHALRKQLDRDAHKDKKDRKYPQARKCECGIGWIIDAKGLKIKHD